MMGAEIITLTDQNFNAHLKDAELPVFVDFWAGWCGPCKMLAPVIEELAQDYGQRIQIAKLNVDENRETAEKFGILSIPTMILFKEGNEVTRITGFRPKREIARFIDEHLV
jgi:thioredoxin 1